MGIKKFVIGLFVTILLLGFNIALAEDSGGIGIGATQIIGQPKRSWFIYKDVKPGQVISDKAFVENKTKEPVTVLVYPIDVHILEDGGYTPDVDSAVPIEVGSWITTDKSEIVLGPGEKQFVGFTITIPKKVAVGDHTGGILTKRKIPTKQVKTDLLTGNSIETGVNIVTRVGVRVYISIAGDAIKRLSFNELSFGQMANGGPVFYFSLTNDGNTKLNPSASVEVYDAKDNKLVQTFSASMKELFPGNKVKIPVEWKEQLNGSFIAKAKIADPNDSTKFLEQEVKFEWKVPGSTGATAIAGVPISKLAVLVGIIILLLLAIILKHFLRKLRR